MPTVTDYRGHRQTLLPVGETDLKACTPIILKQFIEPGLGTEPRPGWQPFHAQRALCQWDTATLTNITHSPSCKVSTSAWDYYNKHWHCDDHIMLLRKVAKTVVTIATKINPFGTMQHCCKYVISGTRKSHMLHRLQLAMQILTEVPTTTSLSHWTRIWAPHESVPTKWHLIPFNSLTTHYTKLESKQMPSFSHFIVIYGKEAKNRWVLSLVLNDWRRFDDVNSEPARDMLRNAGRRTVVSSGDDPRKWSCLSVVVQRFNGVLLHDSFCVEDQPDYCWSL